MSESPERPTGAALPSEAAIEATRAAELCPLAEDLAHDTAWCTDCLRRKLAVAYAIDFPDGAVDRLPAGDLREQAAQVADGIADDAAKRQDFHGLAAAERIAADIRALQPQPTGDSSQGDTHV